MKPPSTSRPLTVRVATTADKEQVIALVNAAFAIETFLGVTRTDEERLAETMNRGDILLGRDDSGCPVASVYVEVRGNRGYLGMLAVDPARQGCGFGRAMVDAAEEFCRNRGCNAMDLTVLSLRPDLPPFYRKLGYVEIGTEEFRPSRPLQAGVQCHCILMTKSL